MKHKLRAFFLIFAALLVCHTAAAQVPPAEQLLPDNTLAAGTIRDWSKANSYLTQTPTSMFWNDAAMKPFRDKFMTRLNEEVLSPLERELGIKVADYKELLQGQITFGVTPPADPNGSFGVIFIMDSRDKSELLKTRLADIQKRWRDSGKQMKSEKIRDIEFTTLIISRKDIKNLVDKVFPSLAANAEADEEEEDKEDAGESNNLNLHVGQSKSLLIIGNEPALIEKVVARQTGGLVTPLAEAASFQKNYPDLFREGVGYGWVRIAPLYEMALKRLATPPEAEPGEPNPFAAFRPEKILPALGLQSLDSLGMTFGGNQEGDRVTFFMAVPEAQREGLFKAFALEKKESTPPPFVPADAVKFQRVRMDLKKSWATLQQMVQNIDPNLAAMLQFGISTVNTVGKEKDPNFDFNQSIIGNLGDDLISYEKAPRQATVEALSAPPSLALIGSPQATQLLDAIRGLTALASPGGDEGLKESEFLGRKIYTFSTLTPNPEAAPDEDPDKVSTTVSSIHFTASGGYIAFSADRGLVEEYLRSGDSGPKPLRATEGFAETTHKVNGSSSGFFGYENQAETMRATLEVLKKDKDGLRKMFEASPLPPGATQTDDQDQGFLSWFDTSLLPNFDAVSKYFGPAVYSINSTADGYRMEIFGPRPAQLKK